MTDLTLYDLHGSPNSVKVRLALGFLDLPYEKVSIQPMDRAPVIEASGQPQCPAIKHGEVRMFDSSAILRYLDANLAGDKRLYSADREEIWHIEQWEMKTRGGGFGEPIGIAFTQAFAEVKDPAEAQRAQELFAERCKTVEDALGDDETLCCGRLTAADLCVVPLLAYGQLPDGFIEKSGPAADLCRFISDMLTIPDDCPKTRAYVERVMAFDR
jgi:glutathione S-transferase